MSVTHDAPVNSIPCSNQPIIIDYWTRWPFNPKLFLIFIWIRILRCTPCLTVCLTSDPQLPSLRPRAWLCVRGSRTARWNWGWANRGRRPNLLSPWTSSSHVPWSYTATGLRWDGKKESSWGKSATGIITGNVAPPPRASSRWGRRNTNN